MQPAPKEDPIPTHPAVQAKADLVRQRVGAELDSHQRDIRTLAAQECAQLGINFDEDVTAQATAILWAHHVKAFGDLLLAKERHYLSEGKSYGEALMEAIRGDSSITKVDRRVRQLQAEIKELHEELAKRAPTP